MADGPFRCDGFSEARMEKTGLLLSSALILFTVWHTADCFDSLVRQNISISEHIAHYDPKKAYTKFSKVNTGNARE